MWCFFDESWPGSRKNELLVIAGILVNEEILNDLDGLLYQVRSKYYGKEHAKNASFELKGKDLLSNSSFRLLSRGDIPYVKNHAVVKDILGWLIKEREDKKSNNYIRVFASVVYGDNPQLLCPDTRKIPWPYRILCRNISTAVANTYPSRRAILIYDQRFQTQTELAITLRQFNQALKVPNIHPVPYFGVSHAVPALQISDIIVYIIARYFNGDDRFLPFYELVKRLQWSGVVGGKNFFGINSWRELADGRYEKIKPKRKRAGALGKS